MITMLRRHWRGAYSLAVSATVMAGVAALPVIIFLAVVIETGDRIRAPWQMFAVLLAFHVLVAAVVVWYAVGLWRTAHAAARRIWRILVRIWVGIVALVTMALLVASAALQFPDAWDIVRDGPDWPPTVIRPIANGRAIALEGHLRWSNVAALRAALRAAPNARVLRLASPGGFLNAGYELHDVVRELGLDTLVIRECTSACTDVFLAGRRRWAGDGARLGFHQGSVGGSTSSTIDSVAARIYRDAGLDPAFIARVLHGGTGIWYPSLAELQAARVVSDVVTADNAPPGAE